MRAERPPAKVRLDAEQQDHVAATAGQRRVQEGVLGPVDLPRLAVDEGDGRPRRLEVVEVLRLDLRKLLGRPRLREVGAGKRRALAAVVPAAKRGDQDGALEARARVDPELVRHRAILRRLRRTPEPDDERRQCSPDRRRDGHVNEHEPPRQMRAVLHLADRHLHGEQPEHEQGGSQVRAAVAARASTSSTANESPKTAVARTCQYTAGSNDQSRRTTVLPG